MRFSTVVRCTTAAAVALLAAACGQDRTTEPGQDETPATALGKQGKSQHLVELRGPKTKAFDDAVAALGGKIKRYHRAIDVVSVTGLSDAAATQLGARADVAAVGPDHRVQWIPGREQFRLERKRLGRRVRGARGTDQSSAFFFDFYQWNIRQIDADQAWRRTTGGRGSTVCVLDTGVDPTHPDLQGKVNLAISASMIEDEPTINDLHFHGTFVSAQVSSTGHGIASVAPNATLCAVKVLDQTGFGTTDEVIAGIIHATDHGADIINMSLGEYVDLNEAGKKEEVRALQKAVNYATRRSVLVVAASGNDAIDLDKDPKQFIHVPSQLDNVVSVGATAPVNQRNFDMLATYSNFGRSGVDVVAPGGDLVAEGDLVFGRDLIIGPCSTFVPGCEPFEDDEGNVLFTWVLGAGTSFASPHAAGEAAVLEALFAGNQASDALAGCIERTADNVGPARFFGDGRINVLKARRC